MVTVVGIGPGHEDYIIPKALKVIDQSHWIVGFERALKTIHAPSHKKLQVETLGDILKIIESHQGNISVVASGDPLFYGISNYLKKNIDGELRVIPGISSFQYLASKKVIPWNDALVSSMHGRENSFLDYVRDNDISFWLTGKKNTPGMLCGILSDNGVQCSVIIGENLSYEDERITEGTPEELLKMEFSSLSVMIVKRRDE